MHADLDDLLLWCVAMLTIGLITLFIWDMGNRLMGMSFDEWFAALAMAIPYVVFWLIWGMS